MNKQQIIDLWRLSFNDSEEFIRLYFDRVYKEENTLVIEKNGQGIQHVAVRVADIEAALAELKEKGVRLIDEKPRIGAGGAKIAFVHPKASGGVLLELCQRD